MKTTYCDYCGSTLSEGQTGLGCCDEEARSAEFEDWFNQALTIARDQFGEDATALRFEFFSLYEMDLPPFPAVCEMYCEEY